MKKAWSILSLLALVSLVGVFVIQPSGKDIDGVEGNGRANTAANSQQQNPDSNGVQVGDPVIPTLTGPVSELPPVHTEPELDREINPRLSLNPNLVDFNPPNGPDPLLARQAEAAQPSDRAFDTPIFNFDGAGYQFLNPPDTVGDVGLNYYIQMINSTIVSIYDKDTAALIQSFDLTDLGGCATGSGDPIVLYDQAADRWMLSEFGSGNSLCVFISQTADPTGSYYSYQFTTPTFPDYPKYGVWPDAYYVAANEGPAVYAFDRNQMLAGSPATSQRFAVPGLSGFGFQNLTPADLDGATQPPAGAPGYYMRHVDTEVHGVSGYPTNDILEVWAFTVDWTTPGNSTFTKIADVLTAEFDSTLCGLSSFYCMGMPGVAQGSTSSLDPLREVVMNRLVYRNFGDHETLVGNFTTDIGSDIGGVRWFELRKVGDGNWTLYQEGTYAPTASDNRWMGAIAMDGSGNIALGYNVSSQTIYPSIRYAGRLASDPLGTMPQGEFTLVDGTAVNGSNRYGDYAAMSVDPEDDCTFWFTGEWNNSSQWSTRIGAFRFDACGTADFTLSAAPDNVDICIPNPATYDITVGQVASYTESVTLSVLGNPAGTTATFVPNSQAAPYTSTLTISNTAAAAPGAYSLEISGIAPTSTHTTTVGLNLRSGAPGIVTLLTPADGATNQPVNPTFTWQADADAASYAIEIASDPAFNTIVESATGLVNTTYTAVTDLNTNATYYWRVWANNACGVGSYSATFSFTVEPAPGDCAPGVTPIQVFSDDFESGAADWTHSGTGDTWALSGANVHGGAFAFHADDVGSVTDQYLISPAVVLPTGAAPLTLQFWNYQEMEDGGGGCYDGGVLEISTDGGSNWIRLDAELLTDPYDGPVSSSYGNPLGGEDAWCGDPQDWLNSIVDLDAFAGQSVQFRFRIATDSSVSHPGWDVDDVVVQSCPSTPANPGVEVSPLSSSLFGDTGTVVTHTFTITNSGDTSDTFAVSITGNSWPTGSSTTAVGPLSPGASDTVEFYVTVGAPDTSDNATGTFTSSLDGAVFQSVSITTTANTVTPTAGIIISPTTASQFGDVGEVVTYTLTVTNAGNVTDTFAVSLAGGLWPTNSSAASVGPLAPGASGTVEVYVTVGAPGDSDTVTVTFTSALDGLVSADAVLTTMSRYRAYMPMIVRP